MTDQITDALVESIMSDPDFDLDEIKQTRARELCAELFDMYPALTGILLQSDDDFITVMEMVDRVISVEGALVEMRKTITQLPNIYFQILDNNPEYS